MALGLLSRSDYASSWPNVMSEYSGDTLWATLVFFGFCILAPRWGIRRTALGALAFSFTIELSQFYHAPWIDEIRNTRLGGLVLGFGFKVSDLVCYTVGVALGAGITLLLSTLFRPTKPA
jgi:glycopeptide antibiotics resistance protein